MTNKYFMIYCSKLNIARLVQGAYSKDIKLECRETALFSWCLFCVEREVKRGARKEKCDGFFTRLQGMAADRRYPERNVFFFRNDALVLADIAEIAQKNK